MDVFVSVFVLHTLIDFDKVLGDMSFGYRIQQR